MQPKIAPESSSSEKPAGINKRQRARGLLDYTLYNPRTSTHGCGRTELFVSPYILCAAAREDETLYLTWLLLGDSLGSKQPVDIPKFWSLAPMVGSSALRDNNSVVCPVQQYLILRPCIQLRDLFARFFH